MPREVVRQALRSSCRHNKAHTERATRLLTVTGRTERSGHRWRDREGKPHLSAHDPRRSQGIDRTTPNRFAWLVRQRCRRGSWTGGNPRTYLRYPQPGRPHRSSAISLRPGYPTAAWSSPPQLGHPTAPRPSHRGPVIPPRPGHSTAARPFRGARPSHLRPVITLRLPSRYGRDLQASTGPLQS